MYHGFIHRSLDIKLVLVILEPSSKVGNQAPESGHQFTDFRLPLLSLFLAALAGSFLTAIPLIVLRDLVVMPPCFLGHFLKAGVPRLGSFFFLEPPVHFKFSKSMGSVWG